MNIIKIYQDYGIDFLTEGNSHCQPGWVNTHCPFCVGSRNYHLGYNEDDNYYFCWRCGWHSVADTLMKLLDITYPQAKQLIQDNKGQIYTKKPTKKVIVRKKTLKFPSNIIPLTKQQRNYLEKRNYDVDELVKIWDLKGTGPMSSLDGVPYSHRILIPILWQGRVVTYQTRDTTGKQKPKYLTCPKAREFINIKQLLYGKQSAWGKTGIVVEGGPDVWRFGVNSISTSGIEFTNKQVRLIAKQFKRVPVCFDGGEIQARKQADKLVKELKFRGVDSFRVDIEGDPGEMKQCDADYLVKSLI